MCNIQYHTKWIKSFTVFYHKVDFWLPIKVLAKHSKCSFKKKKKFNVVSDKKEFGQFGQ